VCASKNKPWPPRGAIQCSGQWMQRIVNMRLNSVYVAARISPGHTGVKFSARDYTKRDMLCQTQYARLIRVRSTELNTQYNTKHTVQDTMRSAKAGVLCKTRIALPKQAFNANQNALRETEYSVQNKYAVRNEKYIWGRPVRR
jgi:hypothetical protein